MLETQQGGLPGGAGDPSHGVRLEHTNVREGPFRFVGKLQWGSAHEQVKEVEWVNVPGRNLQCFWHSLAHMLTACGRPQGAYEPDALKQDVLTAAGQSLDMLAGVTMDTSDGVQAELTRMSDGRQDTTTLGIIAAAWRCNVGIVVLDERTRLAYAFIPKDAPLDQLGVVSLRKAHFWPSKQAIDATQLRYFDDTLGEAQHLRGGRSQLQEATVSTANVTSWRSGVDQLTAWKGTEEHPYLCAMQEIAAWSDELPTVQARFRAE
eukprot:4272559-Amphidinium_carterae.1